MDNIWRIRTLTTAINAMRPPGRRIFQRYFAGKRHMEPSDRLAFEIISGNETVLSSISIYAPATVGKKTGRKIVTLTAPRLAEKRMIHTAELNAMRAYGEQNMLEMMQSRVAREMLDMRNIFDRTLEYWAAHVLRGQILDSDAVTVLVDYNMDITHTPTLSGNDLWTDTANSNPIEQIRYWKQKIEDDSGHEITGWYAYCGYETMNALLNHPKVTDLLVFERGRQIAEEGAIVRLAGVTIEEYNGSYIDNAGSRQRFVEADAFCLIGEGADVFDCPYAPIIDSEAVGGVGNPGRGQIFFSKSWEEKDPSGRWVKGEARPLPVLQRPDAVIYAKSV